MLSRGVNETTAEGFREQETRPPGRMPDVNVNVHVTVTVKANDGHEHVHEHEHQHQHQHQPNTNTLHRIAERRRALFEVRLHGLHLIGSAHQRLLELRF